MFTHRISRVPVVVALSAVLGCRDKPGANVAAAAAQQAPVSAVHSLIARPKSLELATPYVPPPGDPLAHHTAGFAMAQGYDSMSGRDWARLGNLYLQDGVWNGQRILPEGYVKFVSTVAPAWAADKRPVYGGFFWINGEGELPVPNGGVLDGWRRRSDHAYRALPRSRRRAAGTLQGPARSDPPGSRRRSRC